MAAAACIRSEEEEITVVVRPVMNYNKDQPLWLDGVLVTTFAYYLSKGQDPVDLSVSDI